MKLILPINLLDKVIDHLKFDEVDIITPAILTENYFISINFTQKSYYISPTFKDYTYEDLIFGNILLTI